MAERIGLLGDTHSNFGFIHQALDAFAAEDIGTIIQVGDLGIWPGKKYQANWDAVHEHLGKNGQLVLVAPGNHEDYDQIEKLPVRPNGWQRFRGRIWLAPRGLRTHINGVSFLFLGGAPSVDRMWRLQTKNMKTWWPQEDITEEEIETVIAGGHAQVMIAHDAPLGIEHISRHISGNPNGFQRVDLDYAYEGRRKMDRAFMKVKPEVFVHGHYHFAYHETVGPWETHMMGMSWDGDLRGSLGDILVDNGRVISTTHWQLEWTDEGYRRKK